MPIADNPCSRECGRIVGPKGSRGMCAACAQRERRRLFAADPWRHCDVNGCGRFSKGPGDHYCEMHYARWRRLGDPGPAAGLIGPRGAGAISNNGYRIVSRDGRRGPEHRFVMEAALGRPLFGDENVHHINGDRADNRLENLELWSTSQPSGQRVEDKVAWALEIVARYSAVTA